MIKRFTEKLSKDSKISVYFKNVDMIKLNVSL